MWPSQWPRVHNFHLHCRRHRKTADWVDLLHGAYCNFQYFVSCPVQPWPSVWNYKSQGGYLTWNPSQRWYMYCGKQKTMLITRPQHARSIFYIFKYSIAKCCLEKYIPFVKTCMCMWYGFLYPYVLFHTNFIKTTKPYGVFVKV